MADETADLRAELAIRNAIARLALLADQGDLDDYMDLFADGAEWAFPAGTRIGKQDIRAGAIERRVGGVTGPGTNTRHVVTNVAVMVTGPDQAVADSYFQFLQDTTTSPTIFNTGTYHDEFVRQGGAWRLRRREITLG